MPVVAGTLARAPEDRGPLLAGGLDPIAGTRIENGPTEAVTWRPPSDGPTPTGMTVEGHDGSGPRQVG